MCMRLSFSYVYKCWCLIFSDCKVIIFIITVITTEELTAASKPLNSIVVNKNTY